MPTLRLRILYVFVVLGHARRLVVRFAVTAQPTTAWVLQQLREAMPFGVQPAYLLRDNVPIYGHALNALLAGSGIKQVRTAYRSPWQNPFVERDVATLRRELLDYVIVLDERHLKRLLREFIEQYDHLAPPHQGLEGETPFPTEKLLVGPS